MKTIGNAPDRALVNPVELIRPPLITLTEGQEKTIEEVILETEEVIEEEVLEIEEVIEEPKLIINKTEEIDLEKELDKLVDKIKKNK